MAELMTRHAIVAGMHVECPRRSSVGPHDAAVTHVDTAGDGRTVVSLDCGHAVNMSDGHGLFRAACPSCGTSPAYRMVPADPWDRHEVCASCRHCYTHEGCA